MLKQGDTYQSKFIITQDQVNAFAELSGDYNPIHIDPEFAANTPFKQTIVHGIFSASVFSKVLGTEFPGHGSIYLGQKLEFKRPIFTGKEYEARFEISETREGKHTAIVSTQVFELERGKIVIDGWAEMMNKAELP